MHKAIVLEQAGGPEQLKWKDQPDLEPAQGEVLLRQSVVGA